MNLRVLTALITLCLMQEVFMQRLISERSDVTQNWSCTNNASGLAFNLTQLSGYWYEAARVPNQNVLECLNVSVADSISAENDLNLDLKYISTVNGQWQYSEETVGFPWNEKTQNGIFELIYQNDMLSVKVTYKLMSTDYNQYALICGYATISPIPLFKLFTREREVQTSIIQLVQKIIDENAPGMGSQIAWTEQSPDKCNAGVHHENSILITLPLTLFALVWIKS